MSIGAHQKAKGESDEYVTPRPIVDALTRGTPFDVDPCCPYSMPWETAQSMFTNEKPPRGGEEFPLGGVQFVKSGIVEVLPTQTVFLNPPYSEIERWMGWLANHWNGVALVFARTETGWFHEHVWRKASSALFFEGRIIFCDRHGELATIKKGKNAGKVANSGGPSVLVGYGSIADHMLERMSKLDPDLSWLGAMSNLRAGRLVRI